MKKEFISNILLLLGLNILIKPFYVFGIETQVQNVVGTESYGVYFALFNFCFLFQFFLDLGIQNYTSKTISEERSLFTNQFGKLILVKLVLAILFIALVFSGLWVLNKETLHFATVALILAQLILLSFVVFVRANLSALGLYRLDSLLSALDKFIAIIILGYILYFSQSPESLTIHRFIIIHIIGLSVTLLLAIILLLYKGKRFSFGFSMSYLWDLLIKSAPYALVLLLMSLYTRMDGVMLEHMLDDRGYEAGVYAASFRIMDAFNMLGYLFATLLLPMFAHLKLNAERNELFDEAYRVMFTTILIVTLSGVLYAQPVMDFLYTDSTESYGQIFTVLMTCFFAMAMAYLFGSIITSTGKLRRLNYIYAFGIIINWSLNYFLIPKLMALGAAWATLATQFFVLIGLMFLCFGDLKIRISASLVAKSVLFAVLSLAIFIVGSKFSPLTWLFNLILSAIFSLILSFLLGFLRLDSIQLLKRK